MDCDGHMLEQEHFSKSVRAALRERRIHKNRADYDHSLTEWHVTIPKQRKTMPHRAARVARRTRLALSAMESPSDMPTISMGRIGFRKECRKPAVSQFLYQPLQLTSLNQTELDYSENSDDLSTCEARLPVNLGCPVTFMRISSKKLRPLKHRFGKKTDLTASELQQLTNADTTAGESTSAESSDSAHSPRRSKSEYLSDPGPDPSQGGEKDSLHDEDSAKREVIFRDIIIRLRAQNHEAEQSAALADARAHAAETRARSSETAMSKAATSQLVHQKKMVLQGERQRAMELRKKRNQALHLHGVKQKAAVALLEAEAIREKAEMEVAEIQTRALADAQMAAFSQSQLLVDDHAVQVSAQEEELKIQRLREASEIEAKAQATLSLAESSAREIKLKASEEAAAESVALVIAARSRAEEDVQVIKAEALKHVAALKDRVEEQAQAKLAAASHAQTIADEAATAATCLAADQENRAKAEAYRETFQGLQRAKALEQQRAKKHQRQAAAQRNEATRLQSAREKSEAMLQEANAIKVQAEIDVAELHSRALIEAQTAAASQSRALVDAHFAMAQSEVEELKNQSLREAIQMREEVTAQVQATLSQAESSAHDIKMKASAAAAQAGALAQAAKSRAQHEAQSIKAAALEHAIDFKAKTEEQAQAKLEAAKHAQETAEAAAEAATSSGRKLVGAKTSEQATLTLKQAKHLEQQRSKKHQQQVFQVRQKQELKQHALDEARSQAAEEHRRLMEQTMQEVASLKADAHTEAREIKSKARAAVKARVQDNSSTFTKCVQMQPEIEHLEVCAVPDVMMVEVVVQSAEAEPVPNDAPGDLFLAEASADVSVADVAEAEWEVLQDLSIEQCYDASWNLVST